VTPTVIQISAIQSFESVRLTFLYIFQVLWQFSNFPDERLQHSFSQVVTWHGCHISASPIAKFHHCIAVLCCNSDYFTFVSFLGLLFEDKGLVFTVAVFFTYSTLSSEMQHKVDHVLLSIQGKSKKRSTRQPYLHMSRNSTINSKLHSQLNFQNWSSLLKKSSSPYMF
jgi:hypothetical protein